MIAPVQKPLLCSRHSLEASVGAAADASASATVETCSPCPCRELCTHRQAGRSLSSHWLGEIPEELFEICSNPQQRCEAFMMSKFDEHECVNRALQQCTRMRGANENRTCVKYLAATYLQRTGLDRRKQLVLEILHLVGISNVQLQHDLHSSRFRCSQISSTALSQSHLEKKHATSTGAYAGLQRGGVP